MSTWSQRIRALRRSGLTLANIGAQVGLSPAAVCDLEKKRTRSPRGDAALALDALYRARVLQPKGERSDGKGQGRA